MRDPDDQEVIRQDLQRYRALLNNDTLEEDSQRALRRLLKEASRRLAEIEGRGKD